LLIIAIIGLWTIVSTIAAPVFIHRFLVGYAGSAQIITRTGEYLSGIAFPQAMSAVMQGVRVLRQRVERWTPPRFDTPPPPAVVPAPDTAPVKPESEFTQLPQTNDPTLSRRLMELLRRL